MRKREVKKFLIIDGSLLLHKSNGVHSKLSIEVDGKEVRTGVPFGFLRTLIRLNDKFGPFYTCIVYDSSVTPLREMRRARILKRAKDIVPRYEAFPTYKESRSGLKPEIANGKILLDSFLKNIGLTVAYASPLYEGDDVVSYVTERCRVHCERGRYNGEVTIFSDDKDFNQLITQEPFFTVSVMHRKDELITTEKFEKLFGFHPSEFIIYLSLMGDSNDDIPGIKGIGQKRATELLTKAKEPVYLSLSDSQIVILERNMGLIRLSKSKHCTLLVSHKAFDKRKLNVLLKRYGMVSFLRTNDQEVFESIKPMGFLKER